MDGRRQRRAAELVRERVYGAKIDGNSVGLRKTPSRVLSAGRENVFGKTAGDWRKRR